MLYFDNAATTFPKPPVVLEAVFRCMEEYAANPGRSGHAPALKMDRAIYDVRERLCTFVGGEDPLRTVFTFNGTDSLNLAIHGCVRPGMHVVTTSMEHNSVNRPLQSLLRDGTITLTIVDADSAGRVRAEDVLNAVQEDTGLIVMTHMSNLTGTIQPVEEVGRRLDERVLFLVDAAQSIGVLPIDVQSMGIDLLAFPGHKSLFAPMGTGALYMAPHVTLKDQRQGGTGSFSQDFVQPDLLPDRFESGTPNGPGIIGLGAGLAFIEEQGLGAIHAHEMALWRRMVERLRDEERIALYGPRNEHQGPVLALNIRGLDSAEVAYRLDQEHGICVRPGLHCAPLAHRTIGTVDSGAVRFSFGYFNTIKEVEEAAAALLSIARG